MTGQASKGLQTVIGVVSTGTLITVIGIAVQIGTFKEKVLETEKKVTEMKSENQKDHSNIYKRIGSMAQVISAHTGKPINDE